MTQPKVAILGGSGALGSGLARRLTQAGWSISIGSRQAAPPDRLTYADAAKGCDIAILAVPYAAQLDVIALVAPHLAGKVLIDATVPLVPPAVSRVQLPAEGSAALRARAAAGPDVRVVSAFQNVGAHWFHGDGPIGCDVLVTGDDPAARASAIAIAEACGMRGFHAGPLANAVAAEALTSVLIAINRAYKVSHAGIRITGLDDQPAERR